MYKFAAIVSAGLRRRADVRISALAGLPVSFFPPGTFLAVVFVFVISSAAAIAGYLLG